MQHSMNGINYFFSDDVTIDVQLMEIREALDEITCDSFNDYVEDSRIADGFEMLNMN